MIEGESLNLTMNATGNPPQIHYKWILPETANPAKIRTEGPFISIRNAGRQDRGNYTILAWNGHGNFNTTVTIYIDVLYPPRYIIFRQTLTCLLAVRCLYPKRPFTTPKKHGIDTLKANATSRIERLLESTN